MSSQMPHLLPADPAFLRFVREHEDVDVARLLLGQVPSGIDARAAAEQIVARRKARIKVPDWQHVDDLLYPPPAVVEQASSTATARYKSTLLSGERLVDLTGGMGVDTLALAPAFRCVTYVERDPWLCQCFAHNAARLTEHAIEIVQAAAEDYLATLKGPAVVFIDPARRDGSAKGRFRLQDASPDVPALLPLLLNKAERVLLKASPMLDISEALRALRAVSDVHVVAVGGACKELLLLLAPHQAPPEPLVHCVDLTRDLPPFRFRPSEEREAHVQWAVAGRYLYDPDAAIRKAGAFKRVAAEHGLAKLAPNTHLYTAEVVHEAFPGRVFEVLGDAGNKPRRQLPDGRANVISRNHPLSADRLRARYRLKEGGEKFLIGFRDIEQRPRLVIARRVR